MPLLPLQVVALALSPGLRVSTLGSYTAALQKADMLKNQKIASLVASSHLTKQAQSEWCVRPMA
jgi:hypothetical protein